MSKTISLLICMLILAPTVSAGNGLRLSIVNTSGSTTLDALTYAGGSWFAKTKMNHMAVLVEHPAGSFLFDTGLGRNIDSQYKTDMPWWMKPMMQYLPANPARDQLEAANYPLPDRIILSHVHWDHASGIGDFPESEIWVLPADRVFLENAARGPVMPSQFDEELNRWHEIELHETPYKNYQASFDLFGDGAAIVVPMPGHTPGSLGLFLTTDSGQEILFSGDIVWNAKAIEGAKQKMFMARLTADNDPKGTFTEIKRLQALQNEYPDLLIVPAHDAEVHRKLAFFPNWFK